MNDLIGSSNFLRCLFLLFVANVAGCRPTGVNSRVENNMGEVKPVLPSAIAIDIEDVVDKPSSSPAIRETTLSVKEEWSIEGLGAPAGIIYDYETEEFRLAQIGGEGDARDGDGVISRVSMKGRILELNWAGKMNAPKDLIVQNDSIWVTDIDTLHELDRSTGLVRRSIEIPEAQFLVGIAIDDDDRLLLADLLSSRILRWKNGVFDVLRQGRELESPSRLLFQSPKLLVASWGFTDDFAGDALGSLLECNPETGRVVSLPLPMSGHWMGLCSDGGDGWFLADFETGTILRVLKNKTCERIVVLGRGLGAALYLPVFKLLLVTHVTENRLLAFRISETVANARDELSSPINGEVASATKSLITASITARHHESRDE